MQDLFTSRRFWLAILVLIAVIIAAFNPGFEMRTEDAAGYAMIIVSYLLGVSRDPGVGGWVGTFRSRKFWAAVIGFLVVTLDAFHLALPAGLTQEQLLVLVTTVSGYIIAVAFENPKSINFPGLEAKAKRELFRSGDGR